MSDPESKAVGNPTCPTGGTMTVARRGNHSNVVCSCGWKSPPAFTERMVEADRDYHVKGGRA